MSTTPRPPLSIPGTLRNAFAWLIAALLSGLAIVIGFGLLTAIEAGNFNPADSDFLEALIPGSLFIGTYVAALTALPTVILTWVRRAARWYGPVSHLLMGALTGAAAIQLFGVPLSYGVDGLPMTGFFAAAGLVGGALYWRLSVRS